MIYLISSTDQSGKWFKVGYTTNLNNRLRAYITDNPTFQLIETVETYRKTKMKLETQLHEEILERGFQFQIKMGIETEWFHVPEEQLKEFERLGLQQFKCCKGRKILRWVTQ